MSGFTQATRARARLRMSIDGPAKSGKTVSALRFAQAIGTKVGVCDAENLSALLYVGMVFDGKPLEFLHYPMPGYSPLHYITAINNAAAAGIDTLVIDGISQCWEGVGGILDIHDNVKSKSTFTAWKEVTPMHRRFIEAMLAFPGHLIVTMRSKELTVLEKNSEGKEVPVRKGLAPVQRPGMEYEFGVLCTMDADHVIRVTGSRCSALDGATAHKPGAEFVAPLIEWLKTGNVTVDMPRVAMATDEQVRAIVQARIDLDKVQKIFEATLFRRFQVKELHHLTEGQAATVLAELQAELQARVPTPPASAPAAEAATPTVAAPAGAAGASQTLQEALTTQQAAAGQAAAAAAQVDKDGALQRLVQTRESYYAVLGLGGSSSDSIKASRKELWAKIMARRGVKSATELSVAQIAELANALELKVSEASARQGKAATTHLPKEPAAASPQAEAFRPATPGPGQ